MMCEKLKAGVLSVRHSNRKSRLLLDVDRLGKWKRSWRKLTGMI